jgi:riboflavin kinase / FMN adenylyltransferase
MPDNPDASRLRTYSLDDLPPELRGGAVAIGNFDGVHRGHAALIQMAVVAAHRHGGKAIVLTFDPHPRSFFRPQDPVFILTSPEARARVMRALGVDAVVTLRFDKALSERGPEAFEETVLRDRLGAKWVIVGAGFRFGKGRAGTVEQLAAAGGRLGYEVLVVDPVVDETGERIASSAIREALSAGDIAAANRLLGYRWFVRGTVVAGDRRGRDLGFPTANIKLPADCRLRHGIYAVTLTRKDGQGRPGVASFGRRPQFDNGPPVLEVYVFDFAGDLYGEVAEVAFYDWIRAERAFPSVADLVAAMAEDVGKARSMLASAGGGSPIDEALARIG